MQRVGGLVRAGDGASGPVPQLFHLYLVSDSTGETLTTVSRAVAAQYPALTALEHAYPLIRSIPALDDVIREIEADPGIVLFTLLDETLAERLEAGCQRCGAAAISVLRPVMQLFRSYLGAETAIQPGAQHVLNADYFRRIDALNYTMMHDDGQMPEGLDEADVVLVGVSRTSKTPTAIYLANRGVKTANVPLVPGIPAPVELEIARRPLVVGLIASPERIVQIRENRVISAGAGDYRTAYTDRTAVSEEVAEARRLFARRRWPVIDVTRRSIEETAAEIAALLKRHRLAGIVET